MQARLVRTRDTITPSLLKRLRAAENPRRALQAAGQYIAGRSTRAFNEPKLRSAPWKPLAASTVKAKVASAIKTARTKAQKIKAQRAGGAILKANGVLWHSIRITSLTRNSVSIGTDRLYAKFHQLGTKHIPARPFLPFTAQGRLVPDARRRVESAMRRALERP